MKRTLAALALLASAARAERITCTHESDARFSCLVAEPEVRAHRVEHHDLRFRPGDRITVDAGGCVNVGGHGPSWRRYVDPSGDAADHLYRGLVRIAGATAGGDLVTLQSIRGAPLRVAADAPIQQVFLTLGYQDSQFDDNGYARHDDGPGSQCRLDRDGGPAWVKITVEPTPDDLTGTWVNGAAGATARILYLRQVGDHLFGAAWDRIPGSFHRAYGLQDLLHGDLVPGRPRRGTLDYVSGPHANGASYGKLRFTVTAGARIDDAVAPGSPAHGWNKTLVPWPEEPGVIYRFDRAARNDGESMHHHLKPYRDRVVLMGRVGKQSKPPDLRIGFPPDVPRDYRNFMCASQDTGGWFRNGDDPPDGDFAFYLAEHLRPLVDQIQPLRGPGWLNDGNQIRAKLVAHPHVHTESVMWATTHGRDHCDAPGVPLLPGWMQSDDLSVFLNGQPIAGRVEIPRSSICAEIHRQQEDCELGPILRQPGLQLRVGDVVRVTGVLTLDCHYAPPHFSVDCFVDDTGVDNVELHPVYAIDVARPSAGPDLSGVWTSPEFETLYLRHSYGKVYWLALSRDERAVARLFFGSEQAGQLRGEFADLPVGELTEGHGAWTIAVDRNETDGVRPRPLLKLLGVNGAPTSIYWEKLYDAPNH